MGLEFAKAMLMLVLSIEVCIVKNVTCRLFVRTGYNSLEVSSLLREIYISSPRLPSHNNGAHGVRVLPARSMEIVHRDQLMFNANNSSTSYDDYIAAKLARDVAWVNMLKRKVERKMRPTKVESEAQFAGVVVSGMAEGSGEYFVKVEVGTPSREQYMVIDTGSDVVWMQCEPCKKCYQQLDPVFDPFQSSSYSSVRCGSPVCNGVEESACGNEDRCSYSVSYGDGSRTTGTLATETMTFGNTVVQNVAVGCGHENEGLFTGAGGLLGLGAGPLSFVSQISAQTAGSFSYCLVDRASVSAGTLLFGSGPAPSGSVVTTLLRNRAMPTFYYVELSGIIVGNNFVGVDQGVFSVDEEGRGGVIIDSGTAVTRLRRQAYEALREGFVSKTGQLRRTGGVAIFDTCYDLSGVQAVNVPNVGFYFSNGATLMLPPRNYMVPVDSVGTFCLAFAPSDSETGPSIIGNIQQQGIRVHFDTATSVVAFGVNGC